MAFYTQPTYQNYYPIQTQAIQNAPMPQAQGIPQTIPQAQPIQNGGYVVVQDEEEVRRYPVAHGNLVTFRIENKPIVIEKSMGYSQFDTPHYEKYKLVKEDMELQEEKKAEYLLKSDYETAQQGFLDAQNEIFSQIKELKKQIGDLDKKPTTRKKEVE